MAHPCARPVVLFDLDGTLVDSSADLARSVNDLLAGSGLQALAEERVIGMVGDGAAALVRRAFAASDSEPPPDALERFFESYGRRCLETTVAYPGIPELLRDLAAASRQLAVVTNKPTRFSEQILQGLGLAPMLRAVLGPDLAAARKPSPAHVEAALRALGARPDEAVMAGDGATDMASAHGAGVTAIGVLWGYRPAAELTAAGADYLAESVTDLRALLL